MNASTTTFRGPGRLKYGKVIGTSVSLVVTFIVVQLLITNNVINDYVQVSIATICINIVLGSGLNLITGFTGQFSLGHAGFMALGAYTTALMTMAFPTVWGFVGGLLLGALIAAVVGLLVGLPTLRLHGDYLAIATLGAAEIVRILLLNLGFTNGAAGLFLQTRFATWPWLFWIAVITVFLIWNFIRSVPGRDLIAVREDEVAASSLGVNATRAKTLAFVVGAFFGGVAGGLYASYFYFIKPDTFGFMMSINILIIVVLGGMGSLTGTVLAAILLTIINAALQDPHVALLRNVVYGVILVVIMVFRPQGIMGDRELSLRALQRLVPRTWRRAPKATPDAAADAATTVTSTAQTSPAPADLPAPAGDQ